MRTCLTNQKGSIFITTMLSMVLMIFLFIILVGLAYWGANALLNAFGVGDPIRTVIIVGLVILLVVIFLSMFFGGSGGSCFGGAPHLRFGG